MKKRLISGIIFIGILIVIMFVNNPLVDTLLVIFLSILGIYEYNKAFKIAGYKPISWVGYLSCLMIFFIGGSFDSSTQMSILKIGLPLLVITIFMYIILTNLKRSIVDVAITVFSIVYIPFMFSFVKLILLMDQGRFLIWYVFLGAFMCDTFAYLIGSKFGKNKLCPDISPKKTVEGAIGGIIGVIISYIVLTIFINNFAGIQIGYISVLIAGIIAGIGAQFGDLSASAIKRFCNVKDFGNLIPGHGGILDRFDSILFVAPIVYTFLKMYIL